MKYSIPKIPAVQFTFEKWRGGSLQTLEVACRYLDIVSPRGQRILKKYAIGYCKGESLLVRPQENETAVMFLFKDEFFWTHLRNKEFNEVFKCT